MAPDPIDEDGQICPNDDVAESDRSVPAQSPRLGPSLSRRRMLQATAAGGATALGVSGELPDRVDPAGEAEAAIPYIIAAVGVTAATAFMVDKYQGDDVSPTEQENAIEFEDHLNLYNDAREIAEVSDPNLLSSLERDADALKDTACENAIVAAYETVATGGTRSEAETGVEETIADTFAAPERSLATRVNSIVEGVYQTGLDLGDDDPDYNPSLGGDILLIRADDGTTRPASEIMSETVSFLDGSSSTVSGNLSLGLDDAYGQAFDPFHVNQSSPPTLNGSEITETVVSAPDPADYDGVNAEDYDLDHVDGPQLLVDHTEYRNILTKITDAHDAVVSDVETILSTHFDGIESGDLSLEDLMAPSSLIDVVAEAESWQEASVYFRALALSEATSPCRVEFEVSDTESVADDGDNATNSTVSDGETVTFDGLLGWSLSSDVEDNELPVGSSVDPGAYPGDFYFAFEYTDTETDETVGDVTQLTESFTITGTNDGGDVLPFESREVAEADTSPEEARDIFVEHRDAEQQAKDQTIEVVVPDDSRGPIIGDDFGSNFLPDWMPTGPAGLAIIGGSVIAVPPIINRFLP